MDSGGRKRHVSSFVAPTTDPIDVPQVSQDDMIHNKRFSMISESEAELGSAQRSADEFLNGRRLRL